MKAVELKAKWNPLKGYVPDARDIKGKFTYLGSKVWSDTKLAIVDRPMPEIGPMEVLLKIQACGICGTDVHMVQMKDDGRIMYPGLTAFPCVLGHELSGTVVKAGENAIDRLTGKRYVEGTPVCAEEMMWCGRCRPCADGFPNHCEALQEIGITVDGAFAEYMKVDSRYLWNISPLLEKYDENKMYLLGSLVEPTCVAYNAVIERGGGIRPGDNVVILGTGPIGLAATAILKHAGAKKVIVSEPEPRRAAMAKQMGADVVINPKTEDFTARILQETNQMGAKLYLEATGKPQFVWHDIEKTIWNARGINSTVVIVARADQKIQMTGEVFQVRRAQVVGAQGHSGHGTFPRVINMMAGGMDLTAIVTKKISLGKVPENIIALQTDLTNCKISYIAK